LILQSLTMASRILLCLYPQRTQLDYVQKGSASLSRVEEKVLTIMIQF